MAIIVRVKACIILNGQDRNKWSENTIIWRKALKAQELLGRKRTLYVALLMLYSFSDGSHYGCRSLLGSDSSEAQLFVIRAHTVKFARLGPNRYLNAEGFCGRSGFQDEHWLWLLLNDPIKKNK